MVPLRTLLVQKTFNQPLLQATFQLPGSEGDDQILRSFMSHHSHQPKGSYSTEHACELLADGKPANFTVLTRITSQREFVNQIREFQTICFTLAETSEPIYGKYRYTTVYFESGERGIKINPRTGAIASTVKLPVAFTDELVRDFIRAL